MKTAPKTPQGGSSEPARDQLFHWLGNMQCCDGWGLFHAPIDLGPAQQDEDSPEPSDDKPH